jgi:hypothetical protein
MLTAKQAKEALGAQGLAEGLQQAQKKKDAPVLLLSAKQLEREAQQQQKQPEQVCPPPPLQPPRPSLAVAKIELSLGLCPLRPISITPPCFPALTLNPFSFLPSPSFRRPASRAHNISCQRQEVTRLSTAAAN